MRMIRIPVRIPNTNAVTLRYALLPRRERFDPPAGQCLPLLQDPADNTWWQADLAGIPDGDYEYDFRIDRPGQPSILVPDPYVEEITRFGGYRGIFRLKNGQLVRLQFDWQNEPVQVLPNNNAIIIYELPIRFCGLLC